MKCKYCGMYLENVDEESPNGMAHTIKCQTKRIHELESVLQERDNQERTACPDIGRNTPNQKRTGE